MASGPKSFWTADEGVATDSDYDGWMAEEADLNVIVGTARLGYEEAERMEMWQIASRLGLHRKPRGQSDEAYAARVTAEQGDKVRRAQLERFKARHPQADQVGFG